MLYEFALDPIVLSTWESFRYFVEKFGVQHGRMISRFPKYWKRMVYEACSRCGGIERKRIEERLKSIDVKLIRTSRSYDGDLSWLENAEAQHRLYPFHAIISDSNPRDVDEILIADSLDETVQLWNVAREACIPRKAIDMAQCVRPLLQACSEILFIDPHFDPSTHRYCNTLKHFTLMMNGNDRIRRVEYHLGDKLSQQFFETECQKNLPTLLPRGVEMTLIQWRQLEGGEELHPRYVLTDIGGVRIEPGLDEGQKGETADISLLDLSVYYQRWNNFQRETAVYEKVNEVKIKGEG